MMQNAQILCKAHSSGRFCCYCCKVKAKLSQAPRHEDVLGVEVGLMAPRTLNFATKCCELLLLL
jgi:hypothetical protein